MNPSYLLGAIAHHHISGGGDPVPPGWSNAVTFLSDILPADWTPLLNNVPITWDSDLKAVVYQGSASGSAAVIRNNILPVMTRPCTVEFDLQVMSDSGTTRKFGLFLQDSASGNHTGYLIHNQSNAWFKRRYVNGVDVDASLFAFGPSLASLPSPVLTAKLVMTTGTMDLYINNVLLGTTSAVDNTWQALRMGLYTEGCVVRCYEIRVLQQ